jgi:ectoine hydroxylase-related dioxygenase (phytanoyl-CoA dioxygenase family)
MAAIPSHQPGPVDERDRYFFHLNGGIVVRGALAADEVEACNRALDDFQGLQPGQWAGHVHGHTYGMLSGVNLQQIHEGGEPFERLIDHPSWYEKLREFIGAETSLEGLPGAISLFECMATLRDRGGAIPMHSGGHSWWHRDGMFVYRDGRFRCSQMNVLCALTDIGPGDGGTMIVPGSHKVELQHPDMGRKDWGSGGLSMDGIEGAVEVHLRAGDALIFCDPVVHGSAARTNQGQRRTLLYRYAPSYVRPRYPYRPSPELLARLTPRRREIVQPISFELAPPAALV